jgi:hypothetical protein
MNCRRTSRSIPSLPSGRTTILLLVLTLLLLEVGDAAAAPEPAEQAVAAFRFGELSNPPPRASNCGPTTVLSENFANETLATLTTQGWTFSGQSNNAELVAATSNSQFLGNKSFLRIGSSNVSQPFGGIGIRPP